MVFLPGVYSWGKVGNVHIILCFICFVKQKDEHLKVSPSWLFDKMAEIDKWQDLPYTGTAFYTRKKRT